MSDKYADIFGSNFERIFVSLISVAAGVTLVYLAANGPLFFGLIKYKTAEIINNQLIGQDAVNMFLISPILIFGGITLYLKKPISRYLLISTPLFLIYYALSYTIGWEWSSPQYLGNSEAFTFHFLFVLISSLIILLYSLSIFPKNAETCFKKNSLIVYSALFTVFLLIFASMWLKEVNEVITTGTARGYGLAPAAFWLVRIFDLGFSIPLGLISVYLLWTRPKTTYSVQFLFYGFFLTMIIAVNAMGIVMYINHDPTFLLRDLVVFLALAAIIAAGFVYVVRNYKEQIN
ncbi:MAG TPA: hypothetical protein DEE98_02015 [Elusimicrobia bacterium]|nr:hypothetical protein [Elusimicrobiota bacterium]